MPDRLAKRVLVVGWDAADWKLIDPLLARGEMPQLARLIAGGCRADLASLDPKLSPLLWTSIATGKTADKHAILNFIEPDPDTGTLRPSCSPTRRTKAIWNILTQRGLRTHVVSWYASHPAEPIRGSVVTNLFQEARPAKAGDAWAMAEGAVHPAAMADAIAGSRVHPSSITRAQLRALVPAIDSIPDSDRRLGLLRAQVAQAHSVQNAALHLLRSPDDAGESAAWDCTLVFNEAIDVVGHHFMQFHAPKMEHVSSKDFERFRHVMHGIYRVQDAMLGELLDAAGPDTTVLVLSDHGFHSDHLRPRVQTDPDDEHAAMDATWHRPHGMLVMSGPGIRGGEAPQAPTLLDITPTILALLGLPAGADMDGRVLHESLEAPLSDPASLPRLPSWDDEPGEAGLHPAELRVDPFEARDAMKQLADLGYVEEASGDQEAALAACERETKSNLGVVYMSTSRHHLAVDVFRALHEAWPDERRFAVNLANCLLVLGRPDEALPVLHALARRDPESIESRLLLASALLARGDAAEAARTLEQAERASPDRVDVLCALGEACTRLERWDEAERRLARAASVDPHSPVVPHARALLELARRRWEPAAEAALDALDRRHRYPEAHYTLGVALAWLGDVAHAIQSFRVALSMRPGMVDAHLFLARLLARQGDAAKGAEHATTARTLLATRPDPSRPHVEPLRGATEWGEAHDAPLPA
ncbi:MAG: alkaline phosphatase family protein [Phycisphaerales bacterium]